MRKLLFNRIGELLVIFFLSLTPLLWFKQGTILVGHDNTYPLAPQPFLANRLTTWTENFFGHDQSLILGTIPIHFIDATPSFLGFSLQTGQKIVYIFWFFSIGVSAYILAWVLRPQSSIFRLTAVILYQFNYFILQGWWIGEKSKFSAYIALPLLLSVLFLVTRSRVRMITGAVLVSLILFVFNGGGLYGTPLFGGAFVAIGLLITLKIAYAFFEKKYIAIGRLIVFCSLSVIGIALINSYLLIPGYARVHRGGAPSVNTVGGLSGIISWVYEISANASFLNLFRLQGIPEWYDNPDHPYAKTILNNPAFITISYLWPLLVFISLFVKKKSGDEKIIVYFFLVYLIGIFLTAGTHPPLGFLYEILIGKIPGFVIFRSPYFKFAPAIFLATAYLISYVIDSFPSWMRRFAFIILCSIVFYYHYPYFIGNFFTWRNIFSTRVTVPSYIFAFERWLNQEKLDSGRVLFLPPNSPDLLYSTYNWGYLSFQALPTLLSGKSVIVNNDQLDGIEHSMVKSLYAAIVRKDDSTIKKIASMLRISYVVLQKDVINDPKSESPIDLDAYIQAVRSNGQFSLLRSFGQWDLYKLNDVSTFQFYTTDQVFSVFGNIYELDPYYYFLEKDSVFVDSAKVASLKSVSDFILPICLTCPFKNKPVIQFPERNILPDSPFYPVVRLLEDRRVTPKDPKAAIYHLLGISLKRTSEINGMFYYQKKVTKDIVDGYMRVLRDIEDNFQRLPSLQEKIDVALDTREFLRAERNFLRPNLHESSLLGVQAIHISRIFTEISRLERQLKLPELALEEANTRVYKFFLNRDKEFELLLRTEQFQSRIKEGQDIVITVDKDVQRTVSTNALIAQSWISFGTMNLSSGFHTLKVSFPEQTETIHALVPLETEFSVGDTVSCFGTRVENLESSKLYQLSFSYLNDFSNNLLLYMWDQEGTARTLTSATRLLASSLTEKGEQVIKTQEGVKGVLVAFCAEQLTQKIIDERFAVKINEILTPVLLLKQNTISKQEVVPVSFRQSGNTRYKIKFPETTNRQQVLVFSERYNDWWELKGVKARHIQVNGYANGWILDEDASGKDLYLVYKGEKYFFYGKLVSLFVASSCVVYLCRVYFLRRKDG